MSEWADLPHDILIEIMRRLSFYDDFVMFGATCKSWQSVCSLENLPLSPRCPWLMLAEDNEQRNPTRVFVNLFDNKVYNFRLPELVRKKCFGTSFGWLLSVGTDFQMNLFHSLSKHLLSLPPQPNFEDLDHHDDDFRIILVDKCVLSRNPWNLVTHEYEGDCIIMVIYCNIKTLAFTRPGYKVWIDIKSHSRCFDDIAFYKGNFYAVDCHGEVFICHIDDDNAFTKSVTPRVLGTRDDMQKYLVESLGELLLVSRKLKGNLYAEDDMDETPYMTTGFTILKLECSIEVKGKNEYKWVNVDSLGDQALFLGCNSSVSLSASSINGCKANCIYFTDDNIEFYLATSNGGGYDMGVFNMEDRTIGQHYQGESLSYYSTPTWYI